MKGIERGIEVTVDAGVKPSGPPQMMMAVSLEYGVAIVGGAVHDMLWAAVSLIAQSSVRRVRPPLLGRCAQAPT